MQSICPCRKTVEGRELGGSERPWRPWLEGAAEQELRRQQRGKIHIIRSSGCLSGSTIRMLLVFGRGSDGGNHRLSQVAIGERRIARLARIVRAMVEACIIGAIF